MISIDSFKTKKSLNGTNYFSLKSLATSLAFDISTMPYTKRVLLENLLRHEDGLNITQSHIKNFISSSDSNEEILFYPARVLMQDFTGVPAVVDLAAMRDALKQKGKDPQKVNPLIPVDLVIDHSVNVDTYGDATSFNKNVQIEMEKNIERYRFLKWGQKAFKNFKVVPPGTGICHQVNLEYLAQVIYVNKDTSTAYPDTLVGTDSHTTMVNGLAVLGWGVGGIEAEAAMLGQGLSMNVPKVVGVELTGKLKEGSTATDLVLTITNILRKHGVVGKLVEFYGDAINNLSLADRATIANMAPEYGATCGFFPIDAETINYLKLSGRDPIHIKFVEEYAKEQCLWYDHTTANKLKFDELVKLDISTVVPSLAGPKRPQDRVELSVVKESFVSNYANAQKSASIVKDGDVVLAAITSCTNTSNPSVMIAAGLVARKARALGLKVGEHVKTSLAPGSQVVTEYLKKANLIEDFEALGFYLVGYGCTTCIGNSGPLKDNISKEIADNDLTVAGVLSGNRNFEGRVHPLIKANYLASPPLVVAYAIAGTVLKDLTKEPIGMGSNGPVYLKDIWPSNEEIAKAVSAYLSPEMFTSRYKEVFNGSKEWQAINAPEGINYSWESNSTYIQNPPYFEARMSGKPTDIKGAHILALLGDSITTDHISPAGNIKKDSPAGSYLLEKGVSQGDFNSYGARRGNHEVMMRGTFANIRLINELVPEKNGGFTKSFLDGNVMSIYDASMSYAAAGKDLVIVAGKEYGTGSSRDWAAKGTRLLGVKAVIAESFERIHRSNLVGMGVLPLKFKEGVTRKTLGIVGNEKVSIEGVSNISPKSMVKAKFESADGSIKEVELICCIDTLDEMKNYQNSGLLPSMVEVFCK